MTPESPAADAPRIVDRPDIDGDFFGRVLPLLSLAMLSALLVQSCLTQPPPAPAVPPFDAAVAEQRANTAALAALGALDRDAGVDDVLATLNFGAINFASGSSDVPPSAQPLLAATARAVLAFGPGVRVVVNGHTDGIGAPEANLALSIQRAEAVRGALLGLGVPAAQLEARGHGDTRPIATNATEEGRFRNRRIEFTRQP